MNKEQVYPLKSTNNRYGVTMNGKVYSFVTGKWLSLNQGNIAQLNNSAGQPHRQYHTQDLINEVLTGEFALPMNERRKPTTPTFTDEPVIINEKGDKVINTKKEQLPVQFLSDSDLLSLLDEVTQEINNRFNK